MPDSNPASTLIAGLPRRSGRRCARGIAVVDAIAALLLAAVAAAGLASAAAVAGVHVRLARERATALGLAGERLEALRAGPRAAGDDTVDGGGVSYVRQWTHVDGRGLPDRLGVRVAWGTRVVELATAAWP